MPAYTIGQIIDTINANYDKFGFDMASGEDLGEMAKDFTGEELEVDYHVSDETNVRLFPIQAWICTDALAGTQLIGNNGRIIGLRNRRGRKFDWDYMWISPDIKAEIIEAFEPFRLKNQCFITILGPFYMSQVMDSDIDDEYVSKSVENLKLLEQLNNNEK
jgi:hypothetical protein